MLIKQIEMLLQGIVDIVLWPTVAWRVNTLSQESGPARPCSWHCQQVPVVHAAPYLQFQCGCQDNHSADCVQKLGSKQHPIQLLASHCTQLMASTALT